MKFKSITKAAALAGVFAISSFAASAQAATLDDVKAAGELKCGINTGLPGFAFTDDNGKWAGFDVAYCRALAAAVLGDPDKVKYVNLTGKNRFPALASGEIDVLSRNTTWTFSRDVDLGFTFLGVSYYDGQGFLGRTSLGVKSAKELDGASICIQTGTTTELNLADFFRVTISNMSRYQSKLMKKHAKPTKQNAATFTQQMLLVLQLQDQHSQIQLSTWCSLKSYLKSLWVH